MMPSNDYICDLDCPAKRQFPFCCQNCKESRKDFVTDKNRYLWDKDRGFRSSNGCKLPREDMPSECKVYDCRHHTFTVIRVWVNGEWIDTCVSENKNNS